MRQNNIEFAAMLNRIREGNQTAQDIKYLEDIASTRGPPPPDVPRMFFMNKDVVEFNQDTLRDTPGKEYVSVATETVDGPLTEEGVEEARAILESLPPKDTDKVIRVSKSKIGIFVEVIANFNKGDDLTNGADGFVKGVTTDASGD